MKTMQMIRFQSPLKVSLILLCVFSPNLIFPVFSFLNFPYESGVDTWLYVLILVLGFVGAFGWLCLVLIKDGFRLPDICVLTFIIFLFLLHYCYYVVGPYDFANVEFVFYFLSVVPAMIMALVILHGRWELFLFSIRIYAFLIALGALIFIVLPFLLYGESKLAVGGMNYQVWSYIGAFIFGVSSYELFVIKRRFRLIWWAVLFTSTLLVIIGAGRGAILVMLFYFLKNVVLNFSFRQQDFFIGLSIVFLAFSLSYGIGIDWDFINHSFDRGFSYITNDGSVDMADGASGRNEVYSIAIQGILASPIFGYGPFYFADAVILPHNIFLTILIQFGVFGLAVILWFFWVLFRGYYYAKNDFYSSYVFNLLLMPIGMLLFSGVYILNSLFIFLFVVFIFKSKVRGVH